MSEVPPTTRLADFRVPAWVTALLVASAAIALGYQLMLAVSPEDTETLESPLAMSVARQLIAGPWGLYGPFNGQNPLVLIHAPLYYRLAALLAWPLFRAGLDPVVAALAAGRSLSLLGLIATMLAAARLAQIDGAARRVGWWAAMLIAASPVLGRMPVAVRPDMLGIALQTTGVLLVLSVLAEGRPGALRLPAAYAMFGLAVCIKQHFLVAPAISTGLLLSAWWRGRLATKPVERSLLVGLAIVLVVYGGEMLVTGGWIWESVFRVAGSVRRLRPAGWDWTEKVFGMVADQSIGLIVLMTAAGLAAIQSRPGKAHRAFSALGISPVVLVLAMAALQIDNSNKRLELIFIYSERVVLPLVFVGCAWIARGDLVGGRLDSLLWAYWGGEFVVAAILCRSSTGAWTNYAIQDIVFGSVLTARVLARTFDAATSPRPLLIVALVALTVPGAVIRDVDREAKQRRFERAATARVFERLGRPTDECFFVDRPGDNRLGGRLDLVYDYWLYPVFELNGLAEPRAVWLQRALTVGPVRVVISNSRSPVIDGLDQNLFQLDYIPLFVVGPYRVWERNDLTRP